MTGSWDDQAASFDRSIGYTYHGTANDGPNQLRAADGLTAHYDEAGNLVELKSSRYTSCVGGPCYQWYAYDWDEVGQLVRARRWDFSEGLPELAEGQLVPADAPSWDLSYAYSLGVRVLKSAKDATGIEHHSLEIFDSLRVQHTDFQTDVEDYRHDGRFAQLYLAGGVGHVFADTNGVLPQPNDTLIHTYLAIGDHLGSTAFVIDHDSGELVERSFFQPFGAPEADYRPDRWMSRREDYQFTGKEEDIEVGLTYFGARYYHARIGRWASADPLTIHSLGADLNPYAYVRGNVLRSIDPFGLDSCGDDGAKSVKCPDGRTVTRGADGSDGVPYYEIEEAQSASPAVIPSSSKQDSSARTSDSRRTPNDRAEFGIIGDRRGWHVNVIDTWKRTGEAAQAVTQEDLAVVPALWPALGARALSSRFLPAPPRISGGDDEKNIGGITAPAAVRIGVAAATGAGAMVAARRIGGVEVVGEAVSATVPVSSLRGRQLPREFSRGVLRVLRKSMAAEGYDLSKPIDIVEIAGRRIILNGHHRARAAGAAGIKEVPVRIWKVTESEGTRIFVEAAEAAERLGLPW